MFLRIHPRYQTLKRRSVVIDAAGDDLGATRPLTLKAMYDRIDEDLAER